jgi:hypothetical protein
VGEARSANDLQRLLTAKQRQFLEELMTMTRKQMAKFAGATALAGLTLSTPVSAPLISNAQAQSYNTTRTYYAAPRVLLNGQPLATSVAPLVRNGRTLVPMRDIFEALGATVVWNQATQEIRAQRGATNIWLQIGNRTARVDQDQKWLDEAPLLYAGSTLVPLRFVSEALGAQVGWNNSTRVVSILTNGRMAANGNVNRRNTDVRGTIAIPAGAVVPVTLDRTLSSATARVGDTFTATVKSSRPGDSEFPPGTVLRGRVTEVRRLAEGSPGVLGLEFVRAVLPGGSNVAIQGDLISLDDESVIQTDGRIMARDKTGNSGTLKAVGIGAAAGFILGKVIDKNSLITGILGAAGGYLYSRNKDKNKAQEAVIDAGSTLGVRLTRSVSYSDASDYYRQRRPYLG